MPGVANSKLIKHTHHDALRNPELAGVANGMWLDILFYFAGRLFYDFPSHTRRAYTYIIIFSHGVRPD